MEETRFEDLMEKLRNKDQKPESPSPEEDSQNEPTSFINKSHLKTFLPYILFMFLLLVLFWSHANKAVANSSSKNAETQESLNVVMPLLAIPQGERVQPALLRVVPLTKNSLTKAQILQVVTSEDLRGLEGKIITKKLLAPNRIIFWKDLSLPKIPSLTPTLSPIIYGKE